VAYALTVLCRALEEAELSRGMQSSVRRVGRRVRGRTGLDARSQCSRLACKPCRVGAGEPLCGGRTVLWVRACVCAHIVWARARVRSQGAGLHTRG